MHVMVLNNRPLSWYLRFSDHKQKLQVEARKAKELNLDFKFTVYGHWGMLWK